MSTAVLAKCDLAADQRSFDWRELGGAKILPAQQFVHWIGPYGGQERAFRVRPAVPLRCATSNKNGPRRAHRDQLMGINRQIIRSQRSGIFQKVTIEPVTSACARQISDLLPKIPSIKFGPPAPDELM